jgi:hypothetical protein
MENILKSIVLVLVFGWFWWHTCSEDPCENAKKKLSRITLI